jgi:hypothetical protein
VDLQTIKNITHIKSKGIPFLGYRIFREYKLLRKSTVMRFLKNMHIKKKTEDITNSVRSWFSFASYANIFSLTKVLNEKLVD